MKTISQGSKVTKTTLGGRLVSVATRNFFVYQDWPRQGARKKSCTIRAVPEGRSSNPASNVPAAAMVGAWRIVAARSARQAVRKSALSCARS